MRFLARQELPLESLRAQDEGELNRLLKAQIPPEVDVSIDAAGRVLAEDETSVSVQDDPYRDAARVLQHDAIAERRVSQVSVMPQGLLTTFTREEILELVAYLDGLRGGADAH